MWDHFNCGRILGIRFAPDGKLIVCDVAKGVYRVDVDTGMSEMLASMTEPIDGIVPKFPDDVDVAKDGTVYWTESSTIADARNFILEVLSGPTGRLLKYDPKTKKNTVLLSEIHLVNGVQLSEKEDFLLVSESARSRVWK
jgi:sugar lactone lactonase YvrE